MILAFLSLEIWDGRLLSFPFLSFPFLSFSRALLSDYRSLVSSLCRRRSCLPSSLLYSLPLSLSLFLSLSLSLFFLLSLSLSSLSLSLSLSTHTLTHCQPVSTPVSFLRSIVQSLVHCRFPFLFLSLLSLVFPSFFTSQENFLPPSLPFQFSCSSARY